MPTGTVTQFSDERGLGTVTGADGREFRFHLVEIADGSRSIDVGQRVVFDELLRLGEMQAGRVRKV